MKTDGKQIHQIVFVIFLACICFVELLTTGVIKELLLHTLHLLSQDLLYN